MLGGGLCYERILLSEDVIRYESQARYRGSSRRYI